MRVLREQSELMAMLLSNDCLHETARQEGRTGLETRQALKLLLKKRAIVLVVTYRIESGGTIPNDSPSPTLQHRAAAAELIRADIDNPDRMVPLTARGVNVLILRYENESMAVGRARLRTRVDRG